MMRAVRRALVAVLACAACRTAVDADALVRTRGVDGAAVALADRVARDPRDAAAWIALAEVETTRGRPGAALVALTRAEALGAPFARGLPAGPRRALAGLYVERARARVLRASPGADADVRRARALGAALDDDLARAAERLALAAALAHVDPARRARAAARLAAVAPDLARGLATAATDDEVATTAAWLDRHRAARRAFEILDRRVEERLAEGARPRWPTATAARWLELRRWWSGTLDPIDRPTVDAIAAAAGGTCAYPSGPVDPACDPIVAAGATEPDGPAWEPALVVAWDRAGWRAPDGDRAAAWMIVAARAVARGQRASWERAVLDHVEVTAVAADPQAPRWARAVAAALAADRAVAPDPELPAPIAGLLAARVAAAPLRDRAVGAAVISRAAPDDRAAVIAVARSYGRDPALADRRAEELAGRALDRAAIAPVLARLFAALGDPARARAWWQAAVDASPDEPGLLEGLALAMVDAGDVPAGELLLLAAAAASGDAGRTYLRAARSFAAIDAHLAAVAAARWAIELAAPGDEAAPAAIAAAALAALGRPSSEVAALAAAPAALDLTDARAAVARAVADPDRDRAAAALATLAAADDPGLARLALAAWHAVVADRRASRPPGE